MPASKTLLWKAMPPTAFLSLSSLLTYLGFRLYYLATARETELKHTKQDAEIQHLRTTAPPMDLLWARASHSAYTVPNALPYILRILAIRPACRPQTRLTGDEVPSVDILITTCNEDVEVVMDTVRATCVLDYPTTKYRIFVCDDGGSKTLKAAVDAHATSYPYLHYTARNHGLVKDYKSGNLNHGLKISGLLHPLLSPGYDSEQTLTACPRSRVPDLAKPPQVASVSSRSSRTEVSTDQDDIGELHFAPWGRYVAGLDADMIPETYWLRALLPHIVGDPDCAMVCPPQTFYDIPIDDPLTQTMSHFAGLTEVVNDSLGHADCLGSGYIMQRAALNSIGGFPTESLSEDVCCSATLLGAGWKTAFVPEAVQYGSVPESYLGHIKQRTRWWVGHLQTAVLFKLRVGSRAKHLNFKQRLAGIAFDLRQLVQIPLALSYVIIPFALLSGSPLVFWITSAQLKVLIRLVSIWTACHWIHNGVMGLIASTGNEFTTYDVRMASYDSELEQWLSPYYFVTFMRSFVLPKMLGGTTMGFKASGSITSGLLERDSEFRAPLFRRLRVILLSYHAIVHATFIAACLIGVILNFARALSPTYIPDIWSTGSPHTTRGSLSFLVTRLGWPPLFWLQYVSSALTPLVYAIWPPTTPDRESLLDRDPVTLVAYPKPETRIPQKTVRGSWRYARATFVMVYTAVLFVANEVLS